MFPNILHQLYAALPGATDDDKYRSLGKQYQFGSYLVLYRERNHDLNFTNVHVRFNVRGDDDLLKQKVAGASIDAYWLHLPQ